MLSKIISVIAFAILAAQCASNNVPRSIGGKYAHDVFEDKNIVILANAACDSDLEKMQTILDTGININHKGLDDATPLMWALLCENYEGFKFLLENGADPNQRMAKQKNALTEAVLYLDGRYLRTLLQYGGNKNTTQFSGQHAILHDAFDLGFFENEWGNYELLLNSGADVNIGTRRGLGEKAVFGWRYDRLNQLLELGYNRNLNELYFFIENDDEELSDFQNTEKAKALIHLEKIKNKIPK